MFWTTKLNIALVRFGKLVHYMREVNQFPAQSKRQLSPLPRKNTNNNEDGVKNKSLI